MILLLEKPFVSHLPVRAAVDELHQAIDYRSGIRADDWLAAGRGSRPPAALNTLPGHKDDFNNQSLTAYLVLLPDRTNPT